MNIKQEESIAGTSMQSITGYQIEYDRNLPKEDRRISETPVMKLKEEGLLIDSNDTQLWKYFELDDIDGVYNCFLEVIKRCINKQNP
jgi:hypothetical protein